MKVYSEANHEHDAPMQNPRPPVKPTGRKYDRVSDLLRSEGIPKEVQDGVRQLAYETRIAMQLAEIRQKAGITQKVMAESLNVGQPAISKLESGKDEEITLREIREYSRVTNQRISMMFGKPFTPIEAIQVHTNGLKYWLDNLAELASQNDSQQGEVKKLLADAFCNILNIIAICHDKIPITDTDGIEEVRMEIISSKPSSGAAAAPPSRETLKA